MTERPQTERPATRRRPAVAGRRTRRPGAGTVGTVGLAEAAESTQLVEGAELAEGAELVEAVAAVEPAQDPEPIAPASDDLVTVPVTRQPSSEVPAQPERRDAPPAARARRPRLALVATVLTPLAIASVVASGVVYHASAARHDQQVAAERATDAARTQAAAAARTAAAAVLSYDYRHFDADVAKAQAMLTGRLAADYRDLQAKTVKPTAMQVHATVTATVKGAAVLDATPTTATVLVFVDQLSKNDKLAAPRLDGDRVTMQLQKVGGTWLVSAFTAL